MRISDQNFIERMAQKDERALDYFIQEYGWIVKSVILKYIKQSDMEYGECLNDTFLAIWNHINDFDGERGPFSSWIAAIARYKAISALRKKGNEVVHMDIDEMELADESKEITIPDDEKKDFLQLIQCLNTTDQELFFKLYYEEKSSEEVSKELGVSKGRLYNHVSRGKRKLRKSLKGGIAV